MVEKAQEQETEHRVTSQRVFVAPSVTAAMYAVRREMGDHAVIVQVRKRSGEENLVEVIATESPTGDTIAEVIAPPMGDPDVMKRFAFLLEQNFSPALQARLLHAAEYLLEENPTLNATQLLVALLEREIMLLDLRDEEHPAMPIMLFGPAGVGKTSVAMKYAVQFRMLEEPLRLINLDSKRSGNRHTLTNFAKLLESKVHHLRPNAAVKKLHDEQPQFDIIDSPPVNPHHESDMESVFPAFQQHAMYRILVLSATYDHALTQRIIDAFSRYMAIDGLILTHLDIAQNHAKALDIILENGIPLAGLSDSADITQGLLQSTAQDWVRAIGEEHARE